MIRPDPDPHNKTSPSWLAWAPPLAAGVLIIAIGGMTTWLALKFDALRPVVGDMIVFVPSQPGGDSWQIEVAATEVSGRGQTASTCSFDPNEMSAAGGSLVIESREDVSPPRFRLHWAGQHTAKGADDCGASADLTLDRYDLQRLANAAGGFGVRPNAIQLP